LKIQDLPLLPSINGNEKIPTGGFGDYAISVNQIKDVVAVDIADDLMLKANQSSVDTLTSIVQANKDDQAAKDAQQDIAITAVSSGAKAYLTLTSLNASTPTLNNLSYVTNDPTSTNNGMYVGNGTAWVKSVYDPLTQSLTAVNAEVANRSSLIDIDYSADGDIALKNRLGFVFGSVGLASTTLNGVTLSNKKVTAQESLFDKYSFSNGCYLYPSTAYFEITNSLGFVISELPSANGSVVTAPIVYTDVTTPLMSKTLCGWVGEPVTLHVPQMLQDRTNQFRNKQVIAGVISADPTGSKSFYSESDIAIVVRPDLLGSAAELHLRDSRTNAVRTVMPITKCAGVPQGTGQAIKVLMIGDSILNRGGSDIVFNSLTSHGYTPQMIGTMLGTAANSITPSSTGGRLAEGREGAMAMHYVYGFTSRAAVAVGEESSYLALAKTDQANKMPFVRLTVNGDDTTFVKNGYIFDMRFYLNRFNFPDPDVVYINLGTNDLIAYSGTSLSSNLGGSLNIILRQTRTALPNAKIIVALPAPAYSDAKDTLWSTNYYDAIRIIQSTVNTIADSKTFICAEWVVMPSNAGFGVTGSTDTTSGAVNGGWSDDVHPLIGGRSVKYGFASAHIAASHLNLI